MDYYYYYYYYADDKLGYRSVDVLIQDGIYGGYTFQLYRHLFSHILSSNTSSPHILSSAMSYNTVTIETMTTSYGIAIVLDYWTMISMTMTMMTTTPLMTSMLLRTNARYMLNIGDHLVLKHGKVMMPI